MNEQFEAAVKRPKTIAETADETLARLRAEELYYQLGGRALSGIGDYEAGWKAAKAYYGAKQ